MPPPGSAEMLPRAVPKQLLFVIVAIDKERFAILFTLTKLLTVQRFESAIVTLTTLVARPRAVSLVEPFDQM